MHDRVLLFSEPGADGMLLLLEYRIAAQERLALAVQAELREREEQSLAGGEHGGQAGDGGAGRAQASPVAGTAHSEEEQQEHEQEQEQEEEGGGEMEEGKSRGRH